MHEVHEVHEMLEVHEVLEVHEEWGMWRVCMGEFVWVGGFWITG